MKSILVIGMGRFGRHLASRMQELGNDVMIVDKSPERIEPLSSIFEDVQICDCTNEAVVRALGVNNFDICFVTIGEDFVASLEVTSLLKELGAKLVVAKAKRDRQADFLRRIGADEVIYPEREIAEKTAIRFNAKNIFNTIELTSEYAIYEVPMVPEWLGHSISELNIRKKYAVNIIAIKNENALNPMPGPDYAFRAGDRIVVIGRASDVFKLTSRT